MTSREFNKVRVRNLTQDHLQCRVYMHVCVHVCVWGGGMWPWVRIVIPSTTEGLQTLPTAGIRAGFPVLKLTKGLKGRKGDSWSIPL